MRLALNVQADRPPEEFVELVRSIDQAGFESIWLADSTLTYRHVFVYLTLAAEHSRRLRLGTAVVHPHVRHPGDSLAALTAIDELAGGRAALGIGAGDHWVEHLGAPIASVAEMREALLMLRTLRAGEAPVDFAGERWRLAAAVLPFRERRDLPLYAAASNPRMLALAGELADGAIAFVGPARAAWARQQVGATAHNFDFLLGCGCSLDRDGAAAHADAAERLTFLEGSVSNVLDPIRGEPDPVLALAIAGTPADAVDRLHRLEDDGFDHILLLPRGRRRRQTIDLLANKVLPKL